MYERNRDAFWFNGACGTDNFTKAGESFISSPHVSEMEHLRFDCDRKANKMHSLWMHFGHEHELNKREWDGVC